MNYKRISQLTLILQVVAMFVNLTGVAAEIVPKGWLKAGSDPKNYEMSVDTAVKHGGKAGANIKFTGDKATGFGTLMQMFKADDYRGKRVRMSGWMKTENADKAQLWMRLDGERRTLGFDNMEARAAKGTTDWKKYEITLDVPEDTMNIGFGAFVAGKGQAWMDDFQFEIVGKDVASTNMMEGPGEEQEMRPPREYPKQPVNLNFED
jgi:hypothetical protein